MYQLNGFHKRMELDNYENGCDPSLTNSSFVDVSFEAQTIQEVLDKVYAFFNVTQRNITLNSCDEEGRIDISLQENDEAIAPSEQELKHWKEGKYSLYYSTYTGTLEKVTTVKF